MRRSTPHFLATSLAVPVLSILVAATTPPAIAAESAPRQIFDFDVPRTTRVRALQALSEQSGIGVGYHSNDDGQGKKLVGPIRGRFSLETAVSVALRSSTLTYRRSRQDMLLVTDAEDAVYPSAQSDPPVHVPTVPSAPEEVTVTAPLQDLSARAAPLVSIHRERIAAIGAQSLSDVLRQISQSAYSRAEGYYASGAQYAEIRGLGPDATLILINGRRALPSANGIASNAFDLNSIPVSAIERIDVLPNAVAASYGADGIAGIINIVLRKHMSAPSVSISYGGAAGGAEQRDVTLAFGSDSEKFKSAVVIDYVDLGGLLGAKRSLWSDQDYRRFAAQDRRSLISAFGNIASVTNANLPGLSSTIAAVPLTDPTPGISREDFIATAGTSNRESLLSYESIVPEATRARLAGTASYSFNDDIMASADVLYADRSSTFYLPPPMLPPALVPSSNAFNPFGTAVLTYRLLPELGPQYQDVEAQWVRTGVALHGRHRNWHWEVSALYSREDASARIHNALDFTSVMRALASADPSQALNVFQSGPIADRQVLDQLIARRAGDAFTSTGKQFVAYVGGKLWPLPAGFIEATVGGEWRRESTLFDTDEIGRFNRSRDINSAFLHIRAPILKNAPAIDELWLTVDSRLDDYSGIGSALRSQYGLEWRPHPSLTVRASESETFRPPSLYESYLPRTVIQAPVPDPARNEAALILVTVGGNPSLAVTTARSWTGGFGFTPDTAMNWNISVDYWRIAAKHLVSVLPPATVLAHEDVFPERVLRAPATEADVQAGRPGQLQAVDSSRLNAGTLEASGIDLLLRTDIQTGKGRFTPELRATWFNTFRSTDMPQQPRTDRVNVASEYGSILEWRAILSMQWRRGPYELTTVARWTPSYSDALAGELTGRKVPSQKLFDLHGSIDFERIFDAKALLGGRLTAGVVNLFDDEPGFSEVGSAFDFSQGDLRGRWYYLRFEKKL
jgi:iron complex outermembrane recepter protein